MKRRGPSAADPIPPHESGTYPAARAVAGPHSDEEAEALLATDATARQLLAHIRWPAGFHCPRCHTNAPARVDDHGMVECGCCEATTSPALGTPFEDGPVSLRQWLLGLWDVLSTERGADEVRLARRLGIDDRAAWRFIQSLGRLLRRHRAEPLRGVVEVLRAPVEVEVGGGGRARTTNVILLAEVQGGAISRVIVERLRHPDFDCAGLITAMVRPGSCVRTGPWQGFAGLRAAGYGHIVTLDEAHDATLDHVRQVASLLRFWLHASRPVQLGRLGPFLDEFSFRFEASLRFAADDRAARFAAALRLGWQARPVAALRAVG